MQLVMHFFPTLLLLVSKNSIRSKCLLSIQALLRKILARFVGLRLNKMLKINIDVLLNRIYVDGTNFTKLNNKFMIIIKIPHSILSCSKSHFPTAIPDIAAL